MLLPQERQQQNRLALQDRVAFKLRDPVSVGVLLAEEPGAGPGDRAANGAGQAPVAVQVRCRGLEPEAVAPFRGRNASVARRFHSPARHSLSRRSSLTRWAEPSSAASNLSDCRRPDKPTCLAPRDPHGSVAIRVDAMLRLAWHRRLASAESEHWRDASATQVADVAHDTIPQSRLVTLALPAPPSPRARVWRPRIARTARMRGQGELDLPQVRAAPIRGIRAIRGLPAAGAQARESRARRGRESRQSAPGPRPAPGVRKPPAARTP